MVMLSGLDGSRQYKSKLIDVHIKEAGARL
jgi:hypothetical protein